jgi:predicted PurR-regulated permease PerM
MKNPYENIFILVLVIFAIVGIVWLFIPFIPALFLSLLISIATFDQYTKLQEKFSKTNSALIITIIVAIVFIFPLSYILLISGFEISELIKNINNDFKIEQSKQILNQIINGLPFPDSFKYTIKDIFDDNLATLINAVKDFCIAILTSIITLSTSFVIFLIITIFSLYYFYLDGKNIVNRIKILFPLEDKLCEVLFNQFSNLSITLVSSVFIIAILQGVVFSIGIAIIGLPVIYFGIAMAMASFIPVLGGLIIWLPLSLYLYAQGEILNMFIILFFGAILIGTVIDNLIRPIIIKKITKNFNQSSVLNHTLMTVLSTLAGIIQFGILGLFIGPIIAAMAISIFDVYAIKYSNSIAKK